jgi:glutamate dehydrogenase
MGTTFVLQTIDETGADTSRVAAAWYAASELLGAESAWGELEALDLKVPVPQQQALMAGLREMVAAATRQIIAAQPAGVAIATIIDDYREAVAKALADAGQGAAERIAVRSAIVTVFELVDLARVVDRPLAEVAAACAGLDASLDLPWLAAAIARLPASNRWQARARAQLASELRGLRQKLLQRGSGQAPQALGAARSVVDELKRNAPQDLAMLSAGLAEIRRLLEV